MPPLRFKTVRAIFYDFETTDQHFLGQILNYSFITVDEQFEPVAELSGLIRISRLQLPSPGAILTNRTDVLLHQSLATDTEKEGMKKIADFIGAQILAAKGQIALVGYNSARFDLPYLRTSFIRNGLNPYFSGGLLYRDLLLAVRCCAVKQGNFPRMADLQSGRVSFRLEQVGRAFDLLQGDQSHESRADVLLEIAVAKELAQRFDYNLLLRDPYEAYEWHTHVREPRVLVAYELQYDLSQPTSRIEVPYALLDVDARSALWINLKRFQELEGEQGAVRKAIQWINFKGGHALCTDLAENSDLELVRVAERAFAQFKEVRLSNFFEPTVCDIEQDIYRLGFKGNDALHAAIWQGKTELIASAGKLSRDLKSIYFRYKLTNYRWGDDDDDAFAAVLRKYALYRYGGQARLKKSPEASTEPQKDFAPTFKALRDELRLRRDQAGAGSGDRELLESLEQFYQASDLYKVAGKELEGAGAATSSS